MSAQPSLAEPSLADAIRLLQASDVPKSKISHWCCSIRAVAAALGLPPESLVARGQALAHRMNQLHHARAGMAEKTLKNHISNLKAALRHLSGDKTIPARGTPLAPEWAELRKLVGHEMSRYHLTGLMRFATGQGLPPDAVDDAFVTRYMSYRGGVLMQDASPRIQRSVVRAWNACVDDHAIWPRTKLAPAPLGGTPPLSWDEFPQKLRAEIDQYLKSLQTIRRKPDGTRRRLSKLSTVETRFAELQAFARRAVALGVPIDSLTSFRALLDPDLVEKVVDDYWQDERPKTYVIDLGWRLLSVARDSGALNALELARLDDLRAALEEHRETGLTPKNKRVVHAILSGKVWDKVVELPERLLGEARKTLPHAPQRASLSAQIAIGIAVLTFAPVRISNLAGIRIDTHLTEPAGLDGNYLLSIPAHEVKNKVDLEFPFDAKLTKLIDIYIREFRPHLADSTASKQLFPGVRKTMRAINSFGVRIARTMEEHIGIRITCHQFRHATAAILLRNDPGNYELVRRVLGHKSIKTTQDFYIGLETLEANRYYGKILRGEIDRRSRAAEFPGC
ncbi:MAG TPA: site-specific integrase [Methylocella sp.]|nr:site-specific integrase [Methylocella sp.]